MRGFQGDSTQGVWVKKYGVLLSHGHGGCSATHNLCRAASFGDGYV
eukprot:COSAG02_NODE_6374_length_3615_cov_3.420648_5_plen_46_part_00